MRAILSINKPMKIMTGLILAGAALFLTRAAVAVNDCPLSATATCALLGNPGQSAQCLTGTGSSLGSISCVNNTTIGGGGGKFPPIAINSGSANLTATSTVTLEGRLACNGGSVLWTVPRTTANPQAPTSVSRFCQGTHVTGVRCRGINAPTACQ
jgi:hypothetical protein